MDEELCMSKTGVLAEVLSKGRQIRDLGHVSLHVRTGYPLQAMMPYWGLSVGLCLGQAGDSGLVVAR